MTVQNAVILAGAIAMLYIAGPLVTFMALLGVATFALICALINHINRDKEEPQ